MTEFLVVATVMAIALLYPYVNGESVATLLVRALMRAARARAFLVSIL
jgi:hypothetical protein